MSYLDWKVGDRVVCVDARWAGALISPLTERQVYTVIGTGPNGRGIGPDGRYTTGIEVFLGEVTNPDGGGGFLSRRFRKIQPRKTSIAIFERMLIPSKQKEGV